jgi:hypothetical protein
VEAVTYTSADIFCAYDIESKRLSTILIQNFHEGGKRLNFNALSGGQCRWRVARSHRFCAGPAARFVMISGLTRSHNGPWSTHG